MLVEKKKKKKKRKKWPYRSAPAIGGRRGSAEARKGRVGAEAIDLNGGGHPVTSRASTRNDDVVCASAELIEREAGKGEGKQLQASERGETGGWGDAAEGAGRGCKVK